MLRKFWKDEQGTETVEWGIMAGLIVGGLVGIVAAIGGWAHDALDGLKSELGAT